MLAVGGIASVISDYIQNLPKVETTLNGITLNEKASDVLFKNKGFIEIKDPHWNSIDRVVYKNVDLNSEGTTIIVDKNQVKRILYQCRSSNGAIDLDNKHCAENGEKILEKYKDEVDIICLKEDYSIRLFNIKKYNVRYYLQYNKVIGILIGNDIELSYIHEDYEKCK